jgi:esterase/lipase superfamily enzyme
MKLQQGEIILAAPHISEATFSRYNREMEGRVRITVYTSNVDLALKTTICDNDRPCMGYYSGKAPTLAEGVDVIDVSAAGIRFAINHNIPFESALVLSDVRRLLLLGRRPPHARTEAFELVSVNKGAYWRTPKP